MIFQQLRSILYNHTYAFLGSVMLTALTWFLTLLPCKINVMFGKGTSMTLDHAPNVQLGTFDRNGLHQEILEEIDLESVPSAKTNTNHVDEGFEEIKSEFTELKIKVERMQELLTK